MEPQFRTIEGNSRGFYLLFAVLAVVGAAGMICALVLFEKGHYLTNMSNRVPWGLPIVMAIFLIGASAGSLVLSALSSVFGKSEYKVFARIAAFSAMLLLIGALLNIILDWGRPERIFVPFTHTNFRSMFSWNGFLYSSYIGICFVYLVAMFNESERWMKTIGLVAVIAAIGVHSGTGAIFGFVHARELYHSPLTAPSFIAAALSSGTALMILLLQATFRYTGRELDERLILGLARLLAVFILVVMYFVFIENVTRSYSPAFYETQRFLLLDGFPYNVMFWGGMILAGSIVPLIILFHPAWRKCQAMISIASVLVVIGVLFERYIIVIPGQVYPLNQFPGMSLKSVFLDGKIVEYHPSLIELVFVTGILAILGVAYLLGLRLFRFLPLEATLPEPAKAPVPTGRV